MRFSAFYKICLGMFVTSFCCISCSSGDAEPVLEPEEELIITPLPVNAEVGKVYALSHDKKNDICQFQFFFGKTRAEELKEAYMGAWAILNAYDGSGNILFTYELHALDTPKEFLPPTPIMDTFNVNCTVCERIRSFHVVIYDGEDAFNDPVEMNQQYRSPHVFSN